MLTHAQVVDRIDVLLDARLAGDRGRLVGHILELLEAPSWLDARAVVLTMAAAVADGLERQPGEEFHRLRVTVADLHGQEREGSVADLPGHIATFQQIVTALANADQVTARALFDGAVCADWQQASRLLIFGLEELIHAFGGCSTCQVA